MTEKQDELLKNCSHDLEKAVWTMIVQRLDWAKLPEAQRNKLRADMDRSDRAILGASVERVISTVMMFAQIEAARTKGDSQ